MKNQIQIGEIIARYRKFKNLSQTELASLLLVSFQTVSKWERGEAMPDVIMLGKICDVLGIDPMTFYKDEEEGYVKKDKEESHYDNDRSFYNSSKKKDKDDDGASLNEFPFDEEDDDDDDDDDEDESKGEEEQAKKGNGNLFSKINKISKDINNKIVNLFSGLDASVFQTQEGVNYGEDDVRLKKNFVFHQLKTSTFVDADLRGKKFSGSTITSCLFSKSDLTNSTFSGSSVRDSKFNFCNMNAVDLNASNIAGTIFQGDELSELASKGCNIIDSEIKESEGTGVVLRANNFKRFYAHTLSLKSSMLSYNNFSQCDFVNCDFENCLFDRNMYSNFQFNGCNIINCFFKGKNIRKATFINCKIDDRTRSLLLSLGVDLKESEVKED